MKDSLSSVFYGLGYSLTFTYLIKSSKVHSGNHKSIVHEKIKSFGS